MLHADRNTYLQTKAVNRKFKEVDISSSAHYTMKHR